MESQSQHIIKLAYQVFGNNVKAETLLNKRQSRFGGQSPMEMLSNEKGVEQVKEALHQIDSGYYA